MSVRTKHPILRRLCALIGCLAKGVEAGDVHDDAQASIAEDEKRRAARGQAVLLDVQRAQERAWAVRAAATRALADLQHHRE